MELPKNTCISCAYLCQFDEVTISATQREYALDEKAWISHGINYEKLVCHKGKQQDYRVFNQRNQVIDIRNEVIKVNTCKSWVEFKGISPMATEQRENGKWAERKFWVTIIIPIIICIIGLITWSLTQFVLK